jgi:glycosyltransferase involved in cell wall biosynthesis
LKKFIIENKFDIVHAHLFPSFYYLGFLKLFNKKLKSFPKIIVTEHSTFNNRRKYNILRHIEKIIYNSFDKIVSITFEVQLDLLKWLKKKKNSKFSVILNGIDFHKILAIDSSKIDLVPEILLKPANIIKVGMVGSFTIQKNHLFMIKALSFLPNNFHLFLLGEGKLEIAIRDYVSKLNLSKK